MNFLPDGLPDPAHEVERLIALSKLDILDTPPEEAFDRITRLARSIFHVPAALVTLIDHSRQWIKSACGTEAGSIERRHAFCDWTIRAKVPLVVEDAAQDPRFCGNPHVSGGAGIRFYAGAPLRTWDGFNIGSLCIVGTQPRGMDRHERDMLSDLARLVMDQMELRMVATIDSLTGAMTRRPFLEAAARDCAAARRLGKPLSCIALDVDALKSINDALGHSAGDLALQTIVARCRSTLRGSDYIGRTGGDNFAIMLPATSGDGAMEVAERLRAVIPDSPLEGLNETVAVTVSLGVVQLEGPGMDAADLMARADLALHASKARGRNRVTRYSEALGLRSISAA